VARVVPFFRETVVPRLLQGEQIIVAAHGNSLRAVIMELEGLSPEAVRGLEIPTGNPRVYEVLKSPGEEVSENTGLRFERVS
jgi:2,3-bisphosphoglycerate-dependent phosphoglycerate mutase